MAEAIHEAGDVVVDTVTITTAAGFTQPILNQVAGIQIFEDIFSPFISGVLVIYDSLDLTTLFPLTGEEVVRIKFHTPSFQGSARTVDSSFYIYKLSDRETVNDSTVIYKLHFISMEAIIDINKKMSLPFEGRCSDIVKDIITKNYGLQTEKQANIEPTPNGIKFVSNYWSPVKTLNYVADRSYNLKKSPTFVFFENRNGLNFISLDTLYAAPALFDFNQTNNDTDKETLSASYSNIKHISIPEGFDYMSGAMEGMYASRQISFDVVTKKYTSRNFDMLSDFYKVNHLNTFPVTSKKVIRKNNSTILYTPKAYGNYSNFGDVTDYNVIQKRVSLMKQINSYKMQIEVYGRTDYTVGQKINLTLYKKQPISNAESNTDLVDKVYSGNYLIAAINHVVTRESHTCIMEIVKESLLVNLDLG